ncbi:AMP-binding protein [Xanthobacteraceae bacterium A53D]
MNASSADTWHPRADDVRNANVSALARQLDLPDYDALHRFSVAHPDAYWRAVVSFCRIAWRKDFDTYLDASGGKAFPRWFAGGELNWTDTVFAWGADPQLAGRKAIVAEREDGSVTTVDYAELESRVRRFAAGLRAIGVKRGERVGLLMETGVEATISLMALSYIGAIVVPLFSGFGADAILSRLESSGARGIIGTRGFRRRGRLVDASAVIAEVMQRLPAIDLLVMKRSEAGDAIPDGAHDWEAIAATVDPGGRAEPMSPDDPFMVIFTSGTTGKPKGAVHTHGSFPLKIAHDSAVHFDVNPGDVFCWPADMGWIAGTLVISCALLRGATLVCYDGAPDFPDWSRMSRLIERHRVTHYGSAPTLIRGLEANRAEAMKGDVSSVRLLITAGEGIDPEHFLAHQRAFGRGECPMINYTGGTEVSGALLSSVIVKPIAAAGFNTGSPGVEVDVVGPDGASLAEGVGELAVRQPFVGMTQSFWRDDARYLESYWSAVPDLWIHGDLAVRDGHGGFFMRGRSDDTIKVAGKRLGPAEVEEVLLELDAVNEAAAIGVDDPVKGQKLVVFLVAAADAQKGTLPDVVTRQVEARLGKPFRPANVHIVPELPKTRSSKVMRRLIRSVYCGLPMGDLSSLDNPSALQEIKGVIPG